MKIRGYSTKTQAANIRLIVPAYGENVVRHFPPSADRETTQVLASLHIRYSASTPSLLFDKVSLLIQNDQRKTPKLNSLFLVYDRLTCSSSLSKWDAREDDTALEDMKTIELRKRNRTFPLRFDD